MKRNILAVLLVAVAVVAANLVGAQPALADIECRYAIHPGTAPAPGLLPDQLLEVSDLEADRTYRTSFDAQQPKWSVLGLRSSVGADFNLGLRDCEWGFRAFSLLPGSLADFIAIDGNQPVLGRMSVTVSNAGGRAGTFGLEYSTGGPVLEPDWPQTLLIRGTPAVVRDVYVPEGGSVTVVLRLVSGDADLAVVDSGSTSDGWLRSRAQAVQSSSEPGLSDERVVLRVPVGVPGRTFGVVVVNNVDATEAVLHRF